MRTKIFYFRRRSAAAALGSRLSKKLGEIFITDIIIHLVHIPMLFLLYNKTDDETLLKTGGV